MIVMLICILAAGSWRSADSLLNGGAIPPAPGDLAGFSALSPIDAHAHAFRNDPAIAALLKRLNLRILNICVVTEHGRGYDEAVQPNQTAREVLHSTGGRAAWCSTFDPQDFEKPGFADNSIRFLNETFAEGAVAVKIWKAIGMDLKKHDGSYLMADDPVFDPIYSDIAARHHTLFAHLAEPASCWLPPNAAGPDYGYYQQHPQWYMFLHPDHPSQAVILAARDHLLEKHPDLRVVGCHLGSMELDVDEIARHFDRYPNFAVDTAARVQYLMMQPPDKVRAFLTKYQDRVLYGTDNGLQAEDDPATTLPRWEYRYLRDWRYFSTNEWIEYHGSKYRGLALPQDILRKLYHDNAVRWVPGILGKE
jgi:predicted TIM-barrel fold metal-dependent hydrolase